MGFLGFPYIDDSFIMGFSELECRRAVTWLVEMFENLGFRVHPEKSKFDPDSSLTFLGYRLDARSMTVRPTEEKCQKVSDKINLIKRKESLSIREVASLAGLLNDVCKGIDYGLSHNKNLERDKIAALRRAGPAQFEGRMHLSEASLRDLDWWLVNIWERDRKIRTRAPRATLTTDASLEGWGAVWGGSSTGGRWSQVEKLAHINVLELEAVWLGLNVFCKDLENTHLRVETDNTTTVSYINSQGGTRSRECDEVARKIWGWCEIREIWLSAVHLPGSLNTSADFESRHFTENTEWHLSDDIFEQICERWGLPDVDLFASRLNHKVPCYASWGPDPFSSFVDAFSISWKDFNLCYLFPPFRLLPRCIQKLGEEKAEAIVVGPAWKGQTWWSLMMKQQKDLIHIKKNKNNLVNDAGTKENHQGRSLNDIELLIVRI